MRNKDIIFAANAPSVQVNKFLDLLQVAIGTGADAASIASSVESVRILSHSRLRVVP
jgi:polysaccharide export outer membrane protein